jgi:ZIP family zinc transporter
VFISNLPEAIAGTSGMVSGGWKKKRILGLWLSISLLCAVFTAIGYIGFEHVPDSWLGFVQAFAGGAILMMLANTMSPEAYEHGGKLAGVFTVLGFAVSVGVILIERMDEVHRLLSK